MAFCSNCGTQVGEGIKFCPNCGTELSAPQKTEQESTEQSSVANAFQSFKDTADTTDSLDPKDISENRVMGIFAYISWLVLVPIFAAKGSKFARFHANQGLCLAIGEAAWWTLEIIIPMIFSAINWRLGYLVGTLMGLCNGVFVLFTVLGIINAAKGKAKELPIIGKFKILK